MSDTTVTPISISMNSSGPPVRSTVPPAMSSNIPTMNNSGGFNAALFIMGIIIGWLLLDTGMAFLGKPSILAMIIPPLKRIQLKKKHNTDRIITLEGQATLTAAEKTELDALSKYASSHNVCTEDSMKDDEFCANRT